VRRGLGDAEHQQGHHLTEWMWGQESVLSLDLVAMIFLSIGFGGLAASWSGIGRARSNAAAAV